MASPARKRADSIPASWTDSAKLVTIHAYDGPMLTGRLDCTYGRGGKTWVSLIVTTSDGVEHRIQVAVAPETVVEAVA